MLDDGSQGKQSLFQLQQVRGFSLPIKLHAIIFFFSCRTLLYNIFFIYLFHLMHKHLIIWIFFVFHSGNISFESAPTWQHSSISRHRTGMFLAGKSIRFMRGSCSKVWTFSLFSLFIQTVFFCFPRIWSPYLGKNNYTFKNEAN